MRTPGAYAVRGLLDVVGGEVVRNYRVVAGRPILPHTGRVRHPWVLKGRVIARRIGIADILQNFVSEGTFTEPGKALARRRMKAVIRNSFRTFIFSRMGPRAA